MRLSPILFAFLLLVSCNTSPQKPLEPNFIGLLKVTITGIGEGAAPTATAEWVRGRVSSQIATVVPVNGTNAPDDVQISRGAVNFSDDDHSNTRYVYSTFDFTNRTTNNFVNFTLYAVNVPTNIGGTALASMNTATGTVITSESVARGFQPAHAMRPKGSSYVVNADNADLQLLTPAEAADVYIQAIDQGILANNATILEYGFVARNLSGGRNISPRNLTTDCTDNSCKGYFTLAYKFPRVSPRQNNPFSFTLYFVVASESTSYISQSLEEQAGNTVTGLTSFSGFSQLRNLGGTDSGLMGQDNLGNLCQVKTAVSTVANPSNVLMPSILPAATPGSFDSCFGAGGKRTVDVSSSEDRATSLAIQSDGKIVVAGDSLVTNYDFSLTRFNPNGSLDTTFDGDGKVITPIGTGNDLAKALAIQSDGKIVVAGDSSNGANVDFSLVRYNPDGTLDTSFDGDGKVITDFGSNNDHATALALQSDGKIVIAGYIDSDPTSSTNLDFALARYNTNGSLDTTFDGDGKVITPIGAGNDLAYALAIQSDGKIVIAGSSNVGGNDDFALARYNTNGSLDTTFGTAGRVITQISSSADLALALAIQSDGKIVAAGSSDSDPSLFNNYDFVLARYNTNGSLDNTFGSSGKVITPIGLGNDVAYGLAIQSDGKIVLAGSSNADFALARYNTNGSLDTTFDTDGKLTTPIGTGSDQATAVAIQSDGKIVLAGFINNNDFAVARYNP